MPKGSTEGLDKLMSDIKSFTAQLEDMGKKISAARESITRIEKRMERVETLAGVPVKKEGSDKSPDPLVMGGGVKQR